MTTANELRRSMWLRSNTISAEQTNNANALRPFIDSCRVQGMKTEEAVQLAFDKFGHVLTNGTTSQVIAFGEVVNAARRDCVGMYAAQKLMERGNA